MSEWKPIETAPERTTILLWQPGRESGVDIGRLKRGCYYYGDPPGAPAHTEYWGGLYLADRSNRQWREPTHWMPLPEPPR